MDGIKSIQPYWDVQKINEIKTPEEAAEAFEAFFVRMILKEFRKSIPEGLFNSSFSSKMYLDMFDMQIAQAIAQSDQLGLKEYILQSLDREKAIKAYGQD